MDTTQTLAAISALAHDARLAVFRLLVQAGPEGHPAGVIADQLGLAPSALSFHLKELTRAGLLLQRPAGRRIVYRANFESMTALIAYLTENCCSSSACTLAATSGACA